MIWFDLAALVLLSTAFSTLHEARCSTLAEQERPERIPAFERTSQSSQREPHAA